MTISMFWMEKNIHKKDKQEKSGIFLALIDSLFLMLRMIYVSIWFESDESI